MEGLSPVSRVAMNAAETLRDAVEAELTAMSDEASMERAFNLLREITTAGTSENPPGSRGV